MSAKQSYNHEHKWELLRQIASFACVGVMATLVHYCVALILVEVFLVVSYLANVGGYLCAVSVSLFGHSAFTYRKKVNRQIVKRFIVVSLSTLALSEGLLWVLQVGFAMPARYALAIVVACIPVVTFLVNKFWVYSHHEPE